MKFPVRLGIATLALLVSGCDDQQTSTPGPKPSGPVDVGYITLKPQSVPRDVELPGRIVALATADIRPQVDGIVRKIAFQEGKQVEQGDVLYELDASKFKAAQAAAAAALKKTQANTAGARSKFDRTQKLALTSIASVQTLDDARSTLLQAEADEEAAKAALDAAQINLDNATVRAPISGRVGVSTVSVGALVTENQTDAMVTIRKVDPIYVDLVDSSANLLRIRDEVQAGRLGREKGVPAAVSLILENGKSYQSEGSISLADMVVRQSTGTFIMRATFPNPDRMLLPGMFVRAFVDLGSMPNAYLVPQRAVLRADNGAAVAYIVSGDGKAEQRVLTTSGSAGNSWIVTNGVSDGDRLIVDGFQRLSKGVAVTAVEAVLNENGVVKQTIAPVASEQKGPGL
jgi:membrane fusion protein (multidrug efflux system)